MVVITSDLLMFACCEHVSVHCLQENESEMRKRSPCFLCAHVLRKDSISHCWASWKCFKRLIFGKSKKSICSTSLKGTLKWPLKIAAALTVLLLWRQLWVQRQRAGKGGEHNKQGEANRRATEPRWRPLFLWLSSWPCFLWHKACYSWVLNHCTIFWLKKLLAMYVERA